MPKIQTPKPRPKAKSPSAFDWEIHPNSFRMGSKPTCGTCWHFDTTDDGGICHGVLPIAVLKDGQIMGVFPPVKITWRCPNWRRS